MLYYNKINLSELIYVAKNNNSKECMVCYYWFFNHWLKFQDIVYNRCYDLTVLFLNKAKLLLSLLKVLIMVVLYMALANLKQFLY